MHESNHTVYDSYCIDTVLKPNKTQSCSDNILVTSIMLGYDCYAISTNFSEVSSNLAQADEVGGAQVAMGVLAILAMLALLLCYCLFEPTETAINRGKVQHHRIVFSNPTA